MTIIALSNRVHFAARSLILCEDNGLFIFSLRTNKQTMGGSSASPARTRS